MNQWNIKTDNGKEFDLIQTGFAFKMAKKGEKPINPFFCDSDIAKTIFEEDGEFLRTLGSMKLTTKNGVKIEIQVI